MSRGIQEFFYIVRYFSVFYGSERNDREADCLIEKRSGRMEYAGEAGKTDMQDRRSGSCCGGRLGCLGLKIISGCGFPIKNVGNDRGGRRE